MMTQESERNTSCFMDWGP